MDHATISSSTFKLLNQRSLKQVRGDVGYSVPTRVAASIPDGSLEDGRTYEATTTVGVKDTAGNALAQDHTWHFTVENA